MGSKITGIKLINYGLLSDFSCDKLGGVNLIIGENSTGKTFLLKALYSAIRTMEEYHRGEDIRTAADILADKLRWTFQVDKLGDIVMRGADGPLKCKISTDSEVFEYQFSKDAATKIITVNGPSENRPENSVFLPAKEVLSLFSIILKSRDIDKSFGFDDTYYDLVKAIRIAPTRGKNYTAFAESRKVVGNVIDGVIEYSEQTGKWTYKNKRGQIFSIGATSEGIKKVSIMDRLLANGYLGYGSIVFIDEVESALHPEAVCEFLDMIALLADKMEIQFFIASHSYFAIKKLVLLASKKKDMYKCISLGKRGEYNIFDLNDGMPSNSIIDESIKLYEEEVTEVL